MKKISEAFSKYVGMINNQAKQSNSLTQSKQMDNKKLLKIIALYEDLATYWMMDSECLQSLVWNSSDEVNAIKLLSDKSKRCCTNLGL